MEDAKFRPDVVAGKYDPSLFDPTGAHLLVNEVFYSLQGEGEHAGQAAVFVRLAKCNLACKFCDTEFETYQRVDVEELVSRVLRACDLREGQLQVPFVVLTGGEPMLQNCGPLLSKLHGWGFRVHIETSGSVWSPWAALLDHICVSPKVPKHRIPEPLLSAAHEFKWIVNAAFLSMYERDADSVRVLTGAHNYLQPESLNPKWTTAASKLVMQHPRLYRLSLQTHKLAGNP